MNCLTIFAEEYTPDVVAVQETWLTSAIKSSFVEVNKFSIVIGDTEGLVHKHGVCLCQERVTVCLMFL